MDSQEEVTPEEVAADSQVEEILEGMETLKEDRWETDLSGMPLSSTTETPKERKNTWRHGSYINKSTGGHPKWTTCIVSPCFFSLTYRDLQPQNGSTPSATGLNKQFKYPMNTTDDCVTTLKKCSSGNLATHYPRNEPLPN